MKANAITVWTALSALAVVLVAGLGWSWDLAGDLAHTSAVVEQLERGQRDDREIVQRLARLEEALAGVQRGQERVLTILDNIRARTER